MTKQSVLPVVRWAARGGSVALVLGCFASAPAAEASEAAMRGSVIAAEKCGKCHAVGVADESPHRITPPLRDLHKDFPIPMLQEALATGTVGGHDEMPMFDLGKDGVEALLTYIDSLAPGGPKYMAQAR